MRNILLLIAVLVLSVSCKNEKERSPEISQADDKKTESSQLSAEPELIREKPSDIETPEGMVWVSGIEFTMGARDDDPYALPREKPAHPVAVDGFFIDKTEVTNAEFREFVEATGYVTVAERPIDWEQIKKQVAPGTPKPHDSLLQPGSLIFRKELESVNNLYDISQWWEWKIGANWRHPQGPGSSIENMDDYPVVHVSTEDIKAYANWKGRDIPTEAEWEAAAHGKMHGGIYTWGDEETPLVENANTWQGEFPVKNLQEDGYKYAAPVKSFPPNSLGIYDMAGNVWEFTSDNFDVAYYQNIAPAGLQVNPQGSPRFFNPENPYEKEKVIKGGSFLCNKSYCASYRVSARMGMTLDSGSDHVGFRTIKRVKK